MLKRIPLELITRNPEQPRQTFDRRKLEELASSISENGLQQPITVRPIERDADGHEFMIVAGERRFRAHQLLAEDGEFLDVLCHVRKMDDREMHINAILENLQRADVDPLEEAIAFQRMLDDYGFDREQLAKKLGISQPRRISDRVALLGLTEDNRQLLSQGVISLTQASYMAELSPNGQQKFLKVCAQGLASTHAAASAAAGAIAAQEAQVVMPMMEQQPKRASLKTVEDRIDKVGSALQPLFKDGPFKAPDNLDPMEVARCTEKLKLLRQHISQIERELGMVASIAAVA